MAQPENKGWQVIRSIVLATVMSFCVFMSLNRWATAWAAVSLKYWS